MEGEGGLAEGISAPPAHLDKRWRGGDNCAFAHLLPQALASAALASAGLVHYLPAIPANLWKKNEGGEIPDNPTFTTWERPEADSDRQSGSEARRAQHTDWE